MLIIVRLKEKQSIYPLFYNYDNHFALGIAFFLKICRATLLHKSNQRLFLYFFRLFSFYFGISQVLEDIFFFHFIRQGKSHNVCWDISIYRLKWLNVIFTTNKEIRYITIYLIFTNFFPIFFSYIIKWNI